MATSESKTNSKVMFFGNPGVGKSTLINSFLYAYGVEAKAKSGFSHSGSGLTRAYSEIPVNDDLSVLDTPGLADVEIRETACKEIKKALRLNGEYRLVFICTLEAGRVKPEDIETINRVMFAVNDNKSTYCMILNKTSKGAKKKLLKNQEGLKLFCTYLTIKPKHIFICMNDEKAEDEDNVIIEDPVLIALKTNEERKLKDLLLSMEPTAINAQQVQDIPTDNFKEKVAELEKKIREFAEKDENKLAIQDADGKNGAVGPDGKNGAVGPDGKNGAVGPDGKNDQNKLSNDNENKLLQIAGAVGFVFLLFLLTFYSLKTSHVIPGKT